MRTLFIIPLVLMSLVSFPRWGLTMDDLVERMGLFYKKFTSTPFTGEIDEGEYRGSLKNGKREGSWEYYWENGQLLSKGDFRNGKEEGSWVGFTKNGTVDTKYTGTYKNGVKVSD